MKSREVILIFGKTGTGKTTLAKELLKNYSRKIIIDSQLEYRDGLIFESYEKLKEYLLNNDLPESFTFILRFTSTEEIEKFFNIAYYIENYCLMLEEASYYVSPFAKRTNFSRLVNFGRHKEISIIGIARRTTELSPEFRSQVNTIYSFKQTLPKDLENMSKLGFNERELENLPDFEVLRIDY